MKKIFAIAIAIMMVAAMATSAVAFTYPNGNVMPKNAGQPGAQNEAWKMFNYTTYVWYDAISISEFENPSWDQVVERYYRITDEFVIDDDQLPHCFPERTYLFPAADMPLSVKTVVYRGYIIGEDAIECFEWIRDDGTEMTWSPRIDLDLNDPGDQGIEALRTGFGSTLDTLYQQSAYWRDGSNMDACKFYIIVPVEYTTQNIKMYVKYVNGAEELIWDSTVELPDGKERTAITLGDVNNDGEINNKDVTLLFRFASGAAVTGFYEEAADMDGSGQINNKDITLLFRRVSGG